MSQKGNCLLIIAILLFSIIPVIAPAGPQPASNGGGGGGSSGSGSRKKRILQSINT
jgi:hypothetical protein